MESMLAAKIKMILLFSVVLLIILEQSKHGYGFSKQRFSSDRTDNECFYDQEIDSNFDFDESHIKYLKEIEKKIPSYKGDKTLNDHDLELFWFLKAREDYPYSRLLGYNRDIFKKFYDKIVNFSDYKIANDTPIIKDNELISEVYFHKDYPDFKPTIYLDEKFSVGEMERIKRSFILIKIILHSDAFLRQFKEIKKMFSIESYYSQDIEMIDEHTKKNFDNVPRLDEEEIYHFILKTHKKIYIKKTDDSTLTKTGLISSDSVGSIIKLEDGIIRFHNQGKSVNYYSEYLPIILFHEYLHTLGYIHVTRNFYTKTKKNPYDMVYQLSYIFLNLYLKLKFPIIPYCYYKGAIKKWRLL